MGTALCHGCGASLPSSTGAARKWCTDRCRKRALYSRPCIDCGVALSGNDGHSASAPIRCQRCAAVANGRERKVWTRDVIVRAIQEWALEHGGVGPTGGDWNRPRAELGERWPHRAAVYREFGSWPAALGAAGVVRRRARRARAAETRRRSSAASTRKPAVRRAPVRRKPEPESSEAAALREMQVRLKEQAMARWAART